VKCIDAGIFLVPIDAGPLQARLSQIVDAQFDPRLRDHLSMPLDFYPAIRRALFSLEPERAHVVALSALKCAYSLGLLRPPNNQSPAPISLMGLRFPNRIGLAAGFDKNGCCVDALGALGFGFIEVGTVTPRPQAGQARPRLFRLRRASALINRMGFPNEGSARVAARLSRRSYAGVCGVNIGKNAATALTDAVDDYVACLRAVGPVADYVAVNVSSPNTTDLRRLQQPDQLRRLLAALLDARERLRTGGDRRLPLLVKLSPDLQDDELTSIARLIRTLGVDGIIATNTTLSRPDLEGLRSADEEGGLSGAPLRSLSRRAIAALRAEIPRSMPIIAVGGIDSAEEALAALQAGADLVQVFTGLVYRGPRLITELVGRLERL
jgi:dihydroorotate dehydrogenase